MNALRPYQNDTLTELYAWLRAEKGNICTVLPTGAGKSWVIAEFCRDAIDRWPDTSVLMLTHQKELIVQDYEKLMVVWPDAPAGIYSASLKKRQMQSKILFAGIQSVRDRAKEIGFRSVVIIDECHMVSHKEEGVYRQLIEDLKVINPRLRVIGLTATPWRLGHGVITEGENALFNGLIEPVSILQLVEGGYLSPLRSKATQTVLDVTGVHKRGGEFIEHELQKAVDTDENNSRAVREALDFAGDRGSWLFFCSGVEHAMHVRDMLHRFGVSAECVTGDTPQEERDQMLLDFKAGKIRAMTNCNVLTTGFDHPGITMIALMRPTMSATLYMQMVGRGMRISEGKKDCLVLDFAGNISRHGPVTNVQPPAKKGGSGNGDAPVRVCKDCGEIVHISVKVCPGCGFVFPLPEKPKLVLDRDSDIMGGNNERSVGSWIWRQHTSKASGNSLIKVSYYGALTDPAVTEYFSVANDGYAGERARRDVMKIAMGAGVSLTGNESIMGLVAVMNNGRPPSSIVVAKNGKFDLVVRRTW